MEDLLRWVGVVGCGISFSHAVSGIMTCFPAFEASSFSHAFCTLLRGELLESDRIDVHGVGVSRGSRGLGALDPKTWVAGVSP